MKMNKLGELRPNQLITTFGPGALMDVINDSVTILDINYWKVWGKTIYDARLAAYLGVNNFKTPRTTFQGDIPVVSFPNYHVCSKSNCSNLFDLSINFSADKYLQYGPRCPECGFPAYPARFIVACSDGHLDDFPWSWWVHRGENYCKGSMKLISTGKTSSLSDIIVKCSCGATRSMSGATQSENFIGLKCSGRHPHIPSLSKKKDGTYSKCKKPVIPSQRGASNVYFPVIRSAISIPPWINPLNSLIDEHYRDILNYRTDFGDMGVTKIYEKYFEDKFNRAEFDDALNKRDEKIKEFTEIKEMEYAAITHHDDLLYQTNVKYFKSEEETVPEYLKKNISRIVKVHRLREVMVLLGFMRMDSPEPEVDDAKNIVMLSKDKMDESWLPGVEVNGEGVFIEFNKETVQKWKNSLRISSLSSKYKTSYSDWCSSKGWTKYKDRDAEYVLLHSFAHLMIKEMAMQSGYSSSAIKERIYSSETMCGVLLYTGSSDKEGSLGGLVELGNIGSFTKILKAALENALTCTTDPECMINEPDKNKMNGAACHSCLMISETACENGNRLLDRSLVVPLSGKEESGYFRDLVNELCGIQI
ncbi:MAG: DUF1998 domain-containing protein [Clostridium botulinum]|nr:DUF1998 domain-containing protein [Clostridium botulinum]